MHDSASPAASPSPAQPGHDDPSAHIVHTAPRSVVLGLLALAFAVRLLYFWQFRSSEFFSGLVLDEANYDRWAQEISSGSWLGKGPFVMSPLGPYIQALIYAIFGHDLALLRVIQAGVDTLTCYFIYRIASSLGNARVGVIALVLAALYGPMVFYSQNLVAETWSMCLISASISILALPSSKILLRFPAGIMFALAVLGRPNMLVMAPLLPLSASFRYGALPRKMRGQQMLAWMSGIALIMTPVYLRNRHIGGDEVAVTAHGGVNLWIGNNPDADGFFKTPKGSGLAGGQETLISSSVEVAEKAVGRPLKHSEASKWWQSRAIDWMLENPGAALRLMATKIVYYFNAYEKPLESNYHYMKQQSSVLGWLPFGFGFVWPLTLYGAWVSRQRLRRLALLHMYIGAYSATVIVFFISMRYRLPLMVGAIPMAAIGIDWLWTQLQSGSHKDAARSMVPLLACFAFVNQPLAVANIDHDLAHTHFLLGNLAHDAGNETKALEEFEQSVKLYPEWVNFYNNLIVTHVRLKQYDQALAVIEKVKTLEEPDARLYRHQARALLLSGRVPEAIAALTEGTEKKPTHVRLWLDLAELLARSGDRQGAEATLAKARMVLQAPGALNHLESMQEKLDRLTQEGLKLNTVPSSAPNAPGKGAEVEKSEAE